MHPNGVDLSNYESVASNYLSLKYQKSTTSGSIDIGIRKFEFVAKTQFLLVHSIRRLSKIQLYIDERRMDVVPIFLFKV